MDTGGIKEARVFAGDGLCNGEKGRTPPLDLRATKCDKLERPKFVDVLQRDYAAVKAALTRPWSNGPVEGHINRPKLIKRSG